VSVVRFRLWPYYFHLLEPTSPIPNQVLLPILEEIQSRTVITSQFDVAFKQNITVWENNMGTKDPEGAGPRGITPSSLSLSSTARI